MKFKSFVVSETFDGKEYKLNSVIGTIKNNNKYYLKDGKWKKENKDEQSK